MDVLLAPVLSVPGTTGSIRRVELRLGLRLLHVIMTCRSMSYVRFEYRVKHSVPLSNIAFFLNQEREIKTVHLRVFNDSLLIRECISIIMTNDISEC
jgi:hypothetical protein